MRFAVLGAGSAGQGLASYLALKGIDVALFNPPLHAEQFATILRERAIKVSGVIEGRARLARTSCDIREIVPEADVVLMTLRAFAHKSIFESCLPYLRDGQLVVVVTGYWASLRLRKLFQNLNRDIIFAETTLLPLVSEAIGPAEVKISGIKSKVKVSAFPANRTNEVIERLKGALPQLAPGENVLDTNLDSFNPIFHTPIALFNLGCLERERNFEFYHKGTTRKIAAVMDCMDEERRNLAGKLDLKLSPAIDGLKLYYGATGATTYEVFQSCNAYKGYVLPNVFDYIREDVPYGLVPTASLCDALGISCRATKAVISAWSVVDGVDYWQQGITVKELGLDGMDVSQISELVTAGQASSKASKGDPLSSIK